MFSDVLHLQALNGSAWWKLPLGLGTAMQCCAAGAGSGAKYFQKLEIVTRRNDDRLIGYDYFFWHIYIYKCKSLDFGLPNFLTNIVKEGDKDT